MQEKMAKYLVEILGDNLLQEPLPNFPVNLFLNKSQISFFL